MANHFAPFRHAIERPFTRGLAAHLLRRTGFGADPAAIDTVMEQGLVDTVDQLFHDQPEEEANYKKLFDTLNGRLENFTEREPCQAWWLHRMLTTVNPFREKLTLFWHSHFATSINKVEDTRLMLKQIDLLREHAIGDFRTLVHFVAQDPAMVVWLDSESNTKDHPNENFARELMELFTCGIGNYTEADVQAAARAFTGWQRNDAEFLFNADTHDNEVKQFLGKRGRFNGDDIIDILMAQPATPRFIATKLLKYFATPNPAEDVIAEAADVLDRGQLNIKWFLRELFQSEYFFSEACYRKQIASPVDFVVGTFRALRVRQPARELLGNLAALGQELLAPPNVKGWDGGQKWINSSTLAARVEFANMVATLNGGADSWSPHFPIETLVAEDVTKPDQVVQRLIDVLFQGEFSPDTKKELEQFLVSNGTEPQSDTFRDDPEFRKDRTRQLLAILLGMPEYQAV